MHATATYSSCLRSVNEKERGCVKHHPALLPAEESGGDTVLAAAYTAMFRAIECNIITAQK